MFTNNFSDIEEKFNIQFIAIESLEQTEELSKAYLGKKGVLTALMETLKSLPQDEKQAFGKSINILKSKINAKLLQKKTALEEKELLSKLLQESSDPTLPSAPLIAPGSHPINQVLTEVCEIFTALGFSIAEGPEIETDENNFGALNIPEHHPARDMHDTFYITNPNSTGNLLRTHTSPVQVRVMRSQNPPIRIIAPGKVYRHEAVDATHSSVFHQVEGLVVDEGISFADLKGTLDIFARNFFGEKIKTRFRPSYFPFVEPGAEVDITCTVCANTKTYCPVCKGTGWIEMLGAGMVHPNVFKAVGYLDPKLTGFAFGMGIERICMIRYGISDMRLFYENNVDFLKQF